MREVIDSYAETERNLNITALAEVFAAIKMVDTGYLPCFEIEGPESSLIVTKEFASQIGANLTAAIADLHPELMPRPEIIKEAAHHLSGGELVLEETSI